MRNTTGTPNVQRLRYLLSFDDATQIPTSSWEELEQRLYETSQSIQETHDKIRRTFIETHENLHGARRTTSKIPVSRPNGSNPATKHSNMKDFLQRTEDRGMAMKDLREAQEQTTAAICEAGHNALRSLHRMEQTMVTLECACLIFMFVFFIWSFKDLAIDLETTFQ